MGMLVQVRDAVKEYNRGTQAVRALSGVTLAIEAGSFVAVMGASGAGKSTLLHLLGGLDRPTSGEIVVDGMDLGSASDEHLTGFRRRRLGFVFQFFNLLPALRAWENVAVPHLLSGESLVSGRMRARELLTRVGLERREDHRPHELSGGEMQRVAIARALMNDPTLILADEPTGNLDSQAGAQVIELLRSLVDDGRTVVMVTHNSDAAAEADRNVVLADGRVEGYQPRRGRSKRVAAARA